MIDHIQRGRNRKRSYSILLTLSSIFLFLSVGCSKNENHACSEITPKPVSDLDKIVVVEPAKSTDLVIEFCNDFRDKKLLFNTGLKNISSSSKEDNWKLPYKTIRDVQDHDTFVNLECYLSSNSELLIELPNSEFNLCDKDLPENDLLYYAEYWKFKALTSQVITVFNRKHNYIRTIHAEANAEFREELISAVQVFIDDVNYRSMNKEHIIGISENFFKASPIQQELLDIINSPAR